MIASVELLKRKRIGPVDTNPAGEVFPRKGW